MTDSSSDEETESNYGSSSSEEQENGESEDEQMDIADCINLKIGQAGVSALMFHSSDRRLACGTIDGRVRIYDTEGSLEEPLIRGRYHKCVRCVCFHGPNGDQLISGSSMGAFKLHDARTNQLAAKNNKAHSSGINCLLSVNPDQFVSADEDGLISLFDLRKSAQSAVFSLHVQTDWRPPDAAAEDHDDGGDGEEAAAGAGEVADGLCGVAHLSMLPGHLFAACEDGTLTTLSLNKRKIMMKSEFYGHPLTSVWPMKSGAKVVAAAESGSLLLFNRKELGNMSDKCSLLESPGGCGIEAACPIGQDVLVCACSDGRLHALSLLPHARLACLGRQPSDSGACLRLAADPTGSLVASASPESSQIRLWSASRLPELQRLEADRRRQNPSRRKRRAGIGEAKGAAGAKTGRVAGTSAATEAARDGAASFLSGLVDNSGGN